MKNAQGKIIQIIFGNNRLYSLDDNGRIWEFHKYDGRKREGDLDHHTGAEWVEVVEYDIRG